MTDIPVSNGTTGNEYIQFPVLDQIVKTGAIVSRDPSKQTREHRY